MSTRLEYNYRVDRYRKTNPQTKLERSNQNTTHQNTEQTPQEEKINVEIIKRMMSEKKTPLSALRNKHRTIILVETEKINGLLKHISTNNIKKLIKSEIS